MAEYRYLVEFRDSTCLELSATGPRLEECTTTVVGGLITQGYQDRQHKNLGDAMLRVFVKKHVDSAPSGTAKKEPQVKLEYACARQDAAYAI
jgi:hypothetical protein